MADGDPKGKWKVVEMNRRNDRGRGQQPAAMAQFIFTSTRFLTLSSGSIGPGVFPAISVVRLP
jgi:hypothetical protein